MKLRYTERLTICTDFPIIVPRVQIPPLLFISLLENAFKHGVSYREDSFIDVRIAQVDEGILFACKNSKHACTHDTHHGIGIENIKKRLHLLYGNNYTFTTTEDDTSLPYFTYNPSAIMKCLIIDDEPLALTQLSGYISRIPFLTLVASCQDACQASEILAHTPVDLLFADINMPDLNGIDFVRSLPNPPMVIFTTAYSEYAIEGSGSMPLII